ncbi:MAG: hypothetical protein EZS28_015927 [Streblomastix strix]|uniref:Uncharacterized protein n=1 Tax=Streblomastix strix TaxID=222440 RepID=A0A5J4W138_9EUKA|nr:MAG: hypothetical protein EZS28_015926 [Streblomastix strix]KAA6388548.1 MAG: hypothetical protein EZS28_015927 [Streblomastix strix]
MEEYVIKTQLQKIMMKKDDSFGLNFFLSITTMLIKKCVFESSDEKWMNCSYQMYFIYQYGSFKVMNCQETKLILGRIYLEEYGGKVDLATLIKWERICFLANKSIFLCSPTAQEHFYPHLLHIVMDLPITTPSQLVDTALLLLGVFFNARNQSIINDSCILLCKIGANPRILLNSFIARFRQRHADMLLRTGPTEANMTEYIRIFTFFNCMIMMLKSMQLRIYDFDGKELAVIIDSLDKLLHRQLFLQEHTIQSIFEPIQFTQGSGSFEHGNKQNEQSEQSSLLQLVSVTLGVPAQFPNQLGKDIQNSNLQSAKFVVNPAQSCAFRLISFCIFTSLAPSTERCGIQKIILNGIPHNNQENIKILRNKDKILQQELADELFLSCFDRLVDPLTSLLTRMCKCRFQDRYQDSPSELDLIQHNSIPELQVHNHLVGTLALSLLWDIFQMTGGEVAPQQQQIPQNVQVASEEIKKQMELSNVEIDNNINQTITKNYSILKDIPSILLLQQRSPLERIKLTKLGRWGGGIYSPYAIPIINEEIWNNKQQVHLGLNLKDQKNQLDIFSDLPHISITIKRRIREIDLNWLKDTISCAYPDRRSLGIRGLCRALILASVHTPLPEIRQVSSPIPHHFSLEEPEAVLNYWCCYNVQQT